MFPKLAPSMAAFALFLAAALSSTVASELEPGVSKVGISGRRHAGERKLVRAEAKGGVARLSAHHHEVQYLVSGEHSSHLAGSSGSPLKRPLQYWEYDVEVLGPGTSAGASLLQDGLVQAQEHKHQVSDTPTYGFFMSIYEERAAIVHQLRDVRKFYPEAPVYIVSDGGANYTGICKEIGNCKFAWRAGAHACWNPKPWLDRFREAALWLQSRHAEWTIMLEPDVSLHKRASKPVKADAGGLRDIWNAPLGTELVSHLTELGRNYSGNKNFKIVWDRFGLAGGCVIRTAAAVNSFKPEVIDWPLMEKFGGERIYSSDIAMPIALAAHGYNWYPWDEVGEGNPETNDGMAFRHNGKKDNPNGKPWYGNSLEGKDLLLVTDRPHNAEENALGLCQHCIWVNEEDCWPVPKAVGDGEAQNVIRCPYDQQSFRSWHWPVEPPRPELFGGAVLLEEEQEPAAAEAAAAAVANVTAAPNASVAAPAANVTPARAAENTTANTTADTSANTTSNTTGNSTGNETKSRAVKVVLSVGTALLSGLVVALSA